MTARPSPDSALAERIAVARERLQSRRTDQASDAPAAASGFDGSTPARPLSGRLELPGFEAPVEVLTDAAGVPHVFAASVDDLYRTQGFLHHAERGWQVEANVRTCLGELSEIVGPTAIASDLLFRRLGLPEAVEAQVHGAGREVRRVFECYAQGVRAAAAVVPTTYEHRLLGVSPRLPDGTGALRGAIAVSLLADFVRQQDWLHSLLQLAVEPATGELADVDLGALMVALAEILGAAPAGPAGTGSNAWALPRRGEGAVVAGDPHLPAGLPGALMAMHLDTPGSSVIGASLPGVPDLLFGHNGHVAWAVTAAPVRTTGLVLERLTPDRRTADRPNGTVDVAVSRQRLAVRGLPDQELTLRATDRGRLLELSLPGPRPDRTLDVAVTTALATCLYDQQAVARLNAAASAAEFAEAARDWRGAPCSVVFGDREGAVGSVETGVTLALGVPPRLGWAETDWREEARSRYVVRLVTGPVVSCNNRPAGECGAGHWEAPLRAERVAALLEDRPATVAQSVRTQLDVWSGLADRLLADLPAVIEPLLDVSDRAALCQLTRWHRRMYRDLPEPALFAAWVRELVLASVSRLDPKPAQLFLTSKAWLTEWGHALLTAWLDAALDSEGGRYRLARTFRRARSALGPDAPNWGSCHVVRFRHRLSGIPGGPALDAEPALDLPGHDDTICRGDGNPAPACGPGFRMVVDLARPEQSVFAFPVGNSGVPASPHFQDQVESWGRGRYHRMLFGAAVVRRSGVRPLTLVPTAVANSRSDDETEADKGTSPWR